MKTRTLGNSNLQVSAVGLGCNNFGFLIGPEESQKVVEKALDLGITLFDTADIYGKRGGSETILGKALGSRRKDIILATKVGKQMDDAGTMKGASRRYIISEAEASLTRLQTDWIDLYHVHEPDPLTPIEETLRALDDLKKQGKVRYIGCSNFSSSQVVEACKISEELKINRFIGCQDHYSLLVRNIEQELIPAMVKYGLGLLPFFPLAGGMLTGKYKKDIAPPAGTRFASWQDLARRYSTEANWAKVEKLEQFGAERNYSLLEMAFGWLLANPVVSSVIAGATRPEQLSQNIAAADRDISREDMAAIAQLIA